MKYLIFSDTHLTEKFYQGKFDFLKKIISSVDKVIIAGDFYDQYFIDLDKFLNSKWQPLFKLLLKKKAVYIPGNHDLLGGDNQEYDFCLEITDEYQFQSGDENFIVRHGHIIAPGFERFKPFLPDYIRNIFTIVHNLTEKLLVKFFGWLSPSFYVYRYKGLLKTLKYKKKSFSKDSWLILGHVHLPYINRKIKYANTGFINFGLASYVIVEGGDVQLIREKY